jgi:hypothetical protein
MTTTQLEKLLILYKKALADNLTSKDFVDEVQLTEIKLDKSFVETGKEDMNLGEYLEELKTLKYNIAK